MDNPINLSPNEKPGKILLWILCVVTGLLMISLLAYNSAAKKRADRYREDKKAAAAVCLRLIEAGQAEELLAVLKDVNRDSEKVALGRKAAYYLENFEALEKRSAK